MLIDGATSNADGNGKTEILFDDWSIVIKAITFLTMSCSDAGTDPGIHVEERGGREVGYDNSVEQVLGLGDRIWACLDGDRVLSHMGVCLKGTGSREGNDRPLFIHHVPVIRAPDRGSEYHVSSPLVAVLPHVLFGQRISGC